MLKRIFVSAMSLFLIICIIFAANPNVAVSAEEEKVYVVAGSDFQAVTDRVGCNNVKGIISAIKDAGFNAPAGFLFAGDYNNGSDDKSEEIQILKDTVKQEFPLLEDDKMIFTQGNHDPASSKGLSKSGANDTEHYGVFVIHEDEYMQGSTDEKTVKNTAASLEKYLNEKAEADYDKPVFVISHVPLHYSYRTKAGGDGVYAKYLLDVLNKYGDDMNIIFLFGHNHSWTYDNYLGGSAIYLQKGDPIYICTLGDKEALPQEHTLNFTYMNPGYVGYTNCLNSMLTMSVFEITDGLVKVYRYSADGVYPLKPEGEWADDLEETSAIYGGNEDYIKINYNTPAYVGDTASDNGATVVSDGITGLSVTKNTDPSVPEVQSAYAYYDISATGITDGSLTAVTIVPDEGFDPSAPIFVRDVQTNHIDVYFAENGNVVFETDSLSSYEVIQTRCVTVDEHSLRAFTPVGSMADGGEYLVVSRDMSGKACALRYTEGKGLTSAEIILSKGFDTTFTVSFDPSLRWTFESASRYGFSSSLGTLCNKETGTYLVSPDGNILSYSDDVGEGYYVWRLSSGIYGIYTVEASDSEDRYYVKCNDEFYISDEWDMNARVYAYEESVIPVSVKAYIDSVAGSVDADSVTTSSKIYLLGNDGTERVVDVTLSMLKTAAGESVSADTKGVIHGLYVYYNGIAVCGNYTLSVGGDPQYPAPGEESDEISVPETDESEEEDVLSEVSIYHSPNEYIPEESVAATEKEQSFNLWYAAGGITIALAVAAAVMIVVKKRKK